MRIIKSIEVFKKIFENENSETQISDNDDSKSLDNKVDKSKDIKQLSDKKLPNQKEDVESSSFLIIAKKEESSYGKSISGTLSKGKVKMKTGLSINIEDSKKIGNKIEKIELVKKNLQVFSKKNQDYFLFRSIGKEPLEGYLVRIVSIDGNKIKCSYLSKSESVTEEFDFVNKGKNSLFEIKVWSSKSKTWINFVQMKKVEDKKEKNVDVKEKDDEEKEPIKIEKVKDKVDNIQDINEIPKKEIDKIFKEHENDKETQVEYIDEEGKKIKLSMAEAISKLKDNMSASKNESLSHKIFESTQKNTKVKDIWKSFFEEWDNEETFRMTQREVDELDDLVTKGKDNLSLDVSKRPDPIMGIVRVYTRAHELYYTDVIPSGRPGGRVSQKTFREYMQLGTPSYKGKPEDPGAGGPYAVKSIFKQWRNGVLKILQDQKYRELLANINFVVPGAKDRFNPEETVTKKTNDSRMTNLSIDYKIFEYKSDSDIPLKRGESTGQILFEFMTEMLNPKKLDDFEGLESELLNKYFGLDKKKVTKEGGSKPNPTKKVISGDDIDTNHLKWEGKSLKDINSNFSKILDEGNVLTIFIEERNNKFCFVGEIEKVENKDKKITFGTVEFCDIPSKTKLINDIKKSPKTIDDLKSNQSMGTRYNATPFQGQYKNVELKVESNDIIKLTVPNIINDVEFKIHEVSARDSLSKQNFGIWILKNPDDKNPGKYLNFTNT
jgi:hypothetical protein